MFEGLIEFLEETVFGLINRILNDDKRAAVRCEKILTVMLGFAARNPGISRILVGEVLTGETERLRQRIGQFFDRIETQLKQVLREGELAGELRNGDNIGAIANLMLAMAEGRINQYVRSGFKRSPMVEWEAQWSLLAAPVFRQG
jgi:TetR/AcrR family transcriptional regulator